MRYITPDYPLDVYSDVREYDIEVQRQTEKCIRHLFDPSTWKSLANLTAENYGTLLSEIVPTNIVCGIYLIIKLDPLTQSAIFSYIGSSCSTDSGINARIRKFLRAIFGHNLKTDRELLYAKKFLEMYGSNLNNTFVCFIDLQYNIWNASQHEFDRIIEPKVRDIEDCLISVIRKEFGHAACANKNKPVSSKLSEGKRRQRAQNNVINQLPFD